MESVPFTNLYQVVNNPAPAAGKTPTPTHADAAKFQGMLAEAHGEEETNSVKGSPTANLMFNKMGAGVSLPPAGLHSKPSPQGQLDNARTSLYNKVLAKRGIPNDMIRKLSEEGGTGAFMNLRGVVPFGAVDARQAELQNRV
jgi:hypothetical protein